MEKDPKIVEVVAGVDAKGDPEEFTWDLFPLVASEETLHLGDWGLPKAGMQIVRGMILIGLVGKTESYNAERQPDALEIQGLGREHVNEKYGHMWVNRSLYAEAEHEGTVRSARIEARGGVRVGVVEIW